MKIIKNILILLLILGVFLSGCSSTGGTIGGLFPAPKIIKGNIKDGIYTSKNKEFKISVPNWDNKREYRYMKVKEKSSETGEYLSFGPAAFNNNIYRVEYAKKLSFESYYIELKSVKDQIFESYINQIEKAYHAKVELISEDVDLFDAKKSYSRIYRQHVPARERFAQTTIAESLRYHFVDLIDYGAYNIMFWVEIDVNLNNSDAVETLLKNREYQPYQEFIHSFTYQKETNKKLRGEIKDGIYYSIKNEFSVKLPYFSNTLKDKEEWSYTNIHESETKEVDFVIFGPAKTNYNLYHAVLLNFPFKKEQDQYIKFLLEKKLLGRSQGLTQQHFEKFSYKGLDRYYAVFESENDFFIICITNNGDNFYVIEVDISKNSENPSVTLSQLINREFTVFNDMLHSFTILSD